MLDRVPIASVPDSAPPAVRRYADGKAGALKRMADRNTAALKKARRSRCMWAAAQHGEPVAQYVHWAEDGWEALPFSVCAICEPKVSGRRDFRPFGGDAA